MYFPYKVSNWSCFKVNEFQRNASKYHPPKHLEIISIFEQLLVNLRFYTDVINKSNEWRQPRRTVKDNAHHTFALIHVSVDRCSMKLGLMAY